jgi:hypothetical protein
MLHDILGAKLIGITNREPHYDENSSLADALVIEKNGKMFIIQAYCSEDGLIIKEDEC